VVTLSSDPVLARTQPAPALENARIAKAYLEKAGVTFRA